jgi:hypothetical protein
MMRIIIKLVLVLMLTAGIYSCTEVIDAVKPPESQGVDPLLSRSEPLGGKYGPLYDPLKEEEIESEVCPLRTEEIESPPLFKIHSHQNQSNSQ